MSYLVKTRMHDRIIRLGDRVSVQYASNKKPDDQTLCAAHLNCLDKEGGVYTGTLEGYIVNFQKDSFYLSTKIPEEYDIKSLVKMKLLGELSEIGDCFVKGVERVWNGRSRI